ncbi:MAG: hypothetical protein R3A44_39130 [Caldilineaceae bacterium]
MQKQQLSGTLEEQCDFLYRLAQEKMAEGNYTGASHALKEVVRHFPAFQDAAELLQIAQRRKTEQRRLLSFAIVGSVVFTGLGTWLQLANDLIFIVLIVVGAVVGYALGNLINSFRK